MQVTRVGNDKEDCQVENFLFELESSHCTRSEASPEIAAGPGSYGHSLTGTWKLEETGMRWPAMPHSFQTPLRTQEVTARTVIL